MAPRSAAPPSPQHAQLTPDKMRVGIRRLGQCIAEVEAFNPASVAPKPGDLTARAVAMQAAVESALAQTFGHGTVEYGHYASAASFSWSAGFYEETPVHFIVQSLQESRESALGLLRQAVSFLKTEIELAPPPSPTSQTRPNPSNKIFVVHGHDEATLQTVARFLEKLGLEAIILREEPDAGRTIIEKFEDCADDVGFAVVLLTPDDLGGAAEAGATASRARQNVIFELGYFAGKLGRGCTCLMRKGAVEIPSDLYGVIYTELDPGDGWKIKLVKELKVAKLDFDANRMW